jgi:hypothetical protein
VTLRYQGRMSHVRIGHHHRARHVRLYVIVEHIRVIDESGEFLGEITINPAKNYLTTARQPDEN